MAFKKRASWIDHFVAWLRLENALLFCAELCFYHTWSGDWWLFAKLFLLPDLGLLGYIWGPRVGAACYNVTHTLTLPLGLLFVGLMMPHHTAVTVSLIWIIHIAFDRMLGLGLKSRKGFTITHLGTLKNFKGFDQKPPSNV